MNDMSSFVQLGDQDEGQQQPSALGLVFNDGAQRLSSSSPHPQSAQSAWLRPMQQYTYGNMMQSAPAYDSQYQHLNQTQK